MAGKTEEINVQEGLEDSGDHLQRLIYRIIPFWPLFILALLLGYLGARIYLRYQTPVYIAKARLIVNDQTEQKTANLQEIFRVDTRNLTSETEKEIQILSSKGLLTKVASKLQLNIAYSQKGRILTKQFYGTDIPFLLEIDVPDSVKTILTGEAHLKDSTTIIFKGSAYKIDSTVRSSFGNLRWRKNLDYTGAKWDEVFQIAIVPVGRIVSNLKAAITIEPISKQSSIVDIFYADPVPARSIDILNTIINIYGASAVEYKSQIYENSKRFLDNRLNIVSDELSGVEKKLQNFKSSEGIIDLGAEGQLYLDQVKEADKKIAEIEVQQDVLNQIDIYVNRRNSTNDPVPATLGLTDPVITSLLNQLYQAEAELKKIKELSGDKNPQIEVLKEEIAKFKPGIIASINNLRLNLSASKSRLMKNNNELTGMLNKIPLKERLLLDINRQQAIKNAIYTFLLQKREESAIAAASILPNYRLIERPELGGMISPQPSKAYTTAFLIAVLSLVIFIYLKEFARNRILFRSQLEDSLSIPVISELIYYDHDFNNPVVVGAGNRTLIAEQFRELRTNINYITANAPDKCKVILTTSSIPSEGKSFVAINAAISISLTGHKVVLLEFDMRKPKISKPLNIDRDPGLSNYLIGNVTEEQIIKPHATIANLFIIPSGPMPPNPAELMTSVKLTRLFQYLKENFDFVLIDSPPIAPVTDAKILSPYADATLYIVRHNYTSVALLSLLRDVYQKRSLKNINIVFNGIKNRKVLGYSYSGYGYGYGYGYSYSYGYSIEDKKEFSFSKLLSVISFGMFKRKKHNG